MFSDSLIVSECLDEFQDAGQENTFQVPVCSSPGRQSIIRTRLGAFSGRENANSSTAAVGSDIGALPSSPVKRFSSEFSFVESSMSVEFTDVNDRATMDFTGKTQFLVNPVLFARQREWLGNGRIDRTRIKTSTRPFVSGFVSIEKDVYYTTRTNWSMNPPFSMSYCNAANEGKYIAVAEEIGFISIINTKLPNDHEDDNAIVRWKAHENAVFNVKWSKDDTQLFSSSGDQVVTLWDVERQDPICNFHGHTASVKTISLHRENPNILASSGRDGAIMIWDRRCAGTSLACGHEIQRPVDIIRNAHVPTLFQPRKRRRSTATTTASQSVSAMEFLQHQPNSIASVGAADGVLKIWDLRNTGSHKNRVNPSPTQETTFSAKSKRQHGFVDMTVNNSGSHIFAVSTDNLIYMYNVHNLSYPSKLFTGSTYNSSSFYIQLHVSPDDKWIASGSVDGNAHLWEIDDPSGTPLLLEGHQKEVSAVAWCRTDFHQLATCSDDQTIRVWNIDRDKKHEGENDPARRDLCGFARNGEPSIRKIDIERARKRQPQQPLVPRPTDFQNVEPSSSIGIKRAAPDSEPFTAPQTIEEEEEEPRTPLKPVSITGATPLSSTGRRNSFRSLRSWLSSSPGQANRNRRDSQ